GGEYRRVVVDVVDGDGEGYRVGQRAGGCLHDDVVALGGLEVEQRSICDRDHTGGRIDGEPAAGIVGQRVGGCRAAARIGRRRGDADGGAVGGVFVDAVGGAVGIGGRGGAHVVDDDRESMGRAQRAGGASHGDAVGVVVGG